MSPSYYVVYIHQLIVYPLIDYYSIMNIYLVSFVNIMIIQISANSATK